MIYSAKQIPDSCKNDIGGKAGNLLILQNHGLRVPEWFVIPADNFDRFFLANKEHISAVLRTESPAEASRQLTAFILEHLEFETDIASFCSDFSDFPVSVRSSGLAEDSAEHSFAGQYSTFLNVRDNLTHYISLCAASLFTERNIEYHKLNNLDILNNRIAVIIQKMINADSSGVIFTADPVSGEKRFIVNAVFGLGEGLVSDRVISDTYYLNRDLTIEQKIVESKDKRIAYSSDGGVKEISLDEQMCNTQIIEDGLLSELAAQAMTIEGIYNKPQDIEFSILDDEIFILQARPVTTIREKPLTWDNSNIVESFSGPTTPLTFSFANAAYTAIYKSVMLNLGVKHSVIEDNRMIFANMVGYVNKRIYYSLESWFRTLSFLPAYNQNRKFMEGMMGVKDSYDIRKKPSIGGMYEIVKVGVKMLNAFIMHDRNIRRFNRIYSSAMSDFHSTIDNIRSITDYVDLYRRMELKLLHNWVTPINNDIFTMIFYGILQKYIIRLTHERDGRLQNDLLTGEGDIESTKVTELLWEIALMIKDNSSASELIKESPADFLSAMNNRTELFQIKDKFNAFLVKYGNRSVNELKLESPNIKDAPEKIIPLLKQYVHLKDFDFDEILKQETRIRAEAVKIINRHFALMSPFKRFLHSFGFNFVLKNARRFVKNRENLRFSRTNVFGAVKVIFRGIGDEFVRKGILREQGDIFYLTVDEIFAVIYGISVTQNIQMLADMRREEQESLHDKELPERFATDFMPYSELNSLEIGEYDEEIKGLGCSPGIVTGKVQKIDNPYTAEISGDIMIAEKTDPGWLPVFPLFKAIIIERGSMLSHSAIVARELGIPAVVGVRGAMKIFNNGDTVRMNGGTGEIAVIERKKEHE